MKESELLHQNSKEVLQFLRDRYPLFHLSNVFFRDLHYGVREYLDQKGMKVGYATGEEIAREFIKELEGEKILIPVDQQTWTLYYPDFRTPSTKPAESMKPAPKPPTPPSTKPQSGS